MSSGGFRGPLPRSGSQKQKHGHISAVICSRMRHLRPKISTFPGGACSRTPLEYISARCGVYNFLQKSSTPPPPRLCIPGSATAEVGDV